MRASDNGRRELRGEKTDSSLSQEELLAIKARLRYVNDEQPGFQRQRRGRGFVYLLSTGALLRSRRHLERIDSLAIPPAWDQVWICPWPNGHLQCTGRDYRGRKQYIYHARWSEVAQWHKFARLGHFGEQLPRIRRHVARDLRHPGWNERKLAAVAVQLLDRCALRIGNREYTRDNESYGLTTLESRHVNIRGPHVTLEFPAKSGKIAHSEFNDQRLAGLLDELKSVPGPTLLSLRNSDQVAGKPVALTAAMVNGYLQTLTGQHVTAKDFRTWKASLVVSSMLGDSINSGQFGSRLLKDAVRMAAETLGNTPSVCRKHYVVPSLLKPEPDPAIKAALRDLPLSRRRYLSRSEQRLLAILTRVEANGDEIAGG